MRSPFYGVAFRWSAVVVAIVALSPVPLTIPSGLALATIGLIGAVVLMHPIQRTAMANARHAQLHGTLGDFPYREPHGKSGARV
jgi:type III secretory pathway component EscR